MNKIITLCLGLAMLAGCKNIAEKNNFSIAGEIKNIPDQKIYLEELYFTQKNPEVVDTADIKGGKFTVATNAVEQGIYRLRLEKDKSVFIVINDKDKLTLSADMSNLSMHTVNVNSPANDLLKNFIVTTDSQLVWLQNKGNVLQQFSQQNKNDSVYKALLAEYEAKSNSYKKYLLTYIDTCSNAIMSLFALGYTHQVETDKLEKSVAGLSKRYPNNATVASVVLQFNQMMEQTKQQQVANRVMPQPGDMAPEITMPDTEGQPFLLSSLRGKYVLVDFWASWCGPCRSENPNVVAAYNKYKNKNFTVLGVSLDKSKESWLEAIKTDGLVWKHVSDLKHWSSAAVSLYGFEGIPYNVLIDPQGKIIATSLRGEELDVKLASVLK